MAAESLIFTLVILLIFVGLVLFFLARVRIGRVPHLRRIQAFETLKGFTGRAVETGRILHLSLGIGSMANETTADSLAGLSILSYLAEQAALTGVHPTVSMADPTVMLFAQNVVKAAHEGDRHRVEEAFQNVRWIASQPAAYAAGVMSLLGVDDIETNVMVGNFGDEYLLMGEAAVRQDVSHIGGTSNPNTLPFVYASAQETLLGEEMFAAGAYLQKRPAHIASLLTQDAMRWLVFVAIVVGVLAASIR